MFICKHLPANKNVSLIFQTQHLPMTTLLRELAAPSRSLNPFPCNSIHKGRTQCLICPVGAPGALRTFRVSIVALRTSVRVSFHLYTGVRLQHGAPKCLFPTQCYVVLHWLPLRSAFFFYTARGGAGGAHVRASGARVRASGARSPLLPLKLSTGYVTSTVEVRLMIWIIDFQWFFRVYFFLTLRLPWRTLAPPRGGAPHSLKTTALEDYSASLLKGLSLSEPCKEERRK
jgi:hypothetical protein